MAENSQEPRGFATKAEATQANADVWRKFRAQLQDKPITYGVIFVLFGLIVGALLFRYDPEWTAPNNNLFSFLTNFATEGLGVLVTIFVIDRFQAHRQREQLKKQLLIDLKYGTNDAVINAINRMRGYDDDYGWLTGEDGLLVNKILNSNLNNANLTNANLRGSCLDNSKLQEAKLYNAKLEYSKLGGTNLEGAYLQGAHLQNAIFGYANLYGAHLTNAHLEDAKLYKDDLQSSDLNNANMTNTQLYEVNLESATMIGTHLEGAVLSRANLRNVDLRTVYFSEETVLPDGNRYDPQKGPEQMERFTNPEYDGPGGFWDTCLELKRRPGNIPWYCKDQEEE